MNTKEALFEWNQKKWEEKNRFMYQEDGSNQWPWFNEDLDQDILNYLKHKAIDTGRILDLGTCSGSQAIALAKLGYEVVGSDISETALAKALERKDQLDEPVNLEFLFDDIQKSRLENDSFDVILDRGCFHSICAFGVPEYNHHISRILKKSGVVILKTMSIKEERFIDYNNFGKHRIQMPYHFKADELQKAFENQFIIESISDSFFYSSVVSPPAKAWLTVLRHKHA